MDTNLLLLHVVGSHDLSIIEKQEFKRTTAFTVEDFHLLSKLLAYFNKSVTTAHVLTEVSNLAAQLPTLLKRPCFSSFPKSLDRFIELSSDSIDALSDVSFPQVGLTDVALARVATDYLIVTADLRFEMELNRLKLELLNINHLRTHLWN